LIVKSGATMKTMKKVEKNMMNKDKELIVMLRMSFTELSAAWDDRFGQYISLGSGAILAIQVNGLRCKIT
jgi:hypothetical protein